MRTKSLILTWPADQTDFHLVLPQDLIGGLDQGESIRFWVKQVVYQNEFQVITANNDTIIIDSSAVVLPPASPTVLALANRLSALTPLTWAFDTYLGALSITNNDVVAHTFAPGTMGDILGFHDPSTITVAPGQTVYGDHGPNLAPPEALVIRSSVSKGTASEYDPVLGPRTSNILLVVPNLVPPHATGEFRDDYGVYEHRTPGNINTLELSLVDLSGDPLSCGAPILLILQFEVVVDQTNQILSFAQEMIDLQRLQLLRA